MPDVSRTSEGILLADSVNYLGREALGHVVVASSHGGLYAAYKAAASGARAVILSDAGIGREDAGIACLSYCQGLGMAAAVVSHLSARIGEAEDMMRRGVVSHANDVARALGCLPGLACASAATALKDAPPPTADPPPYAETRFVISAEPRQPRVVCIDSASLVEAEDAGQIVVTGSHAVLIGGRREKAFNVDALLAVFNDAGVGIDEAGVGRLDPLDERRIAAATVAHTSARIGDARSTYHDGTISRANQRATGLGGCQGMPVKTFVGQILNQFAH